MKITIAGGSGFLGRPLSRHLASLGHEVVVLTRKAAGVAIAGAPRAVEWDPAGDTGSWAVDVHDADVVINLSGADLAGGRWTAARKVELRMSRVQPTRSLVAAIRQSRQKPAVFIQGSAAGFYGISQGDRELDESFPPGDDFLAELCVAWEAEAHAVSALGCRLVIVRSGVVLASDGGIIGKMRLPFQLFAGGPVASGRQYLPWIHREDWMRLVVWILSTPGVDGVINATAPETTTNREFSAALGAALRRPSWLPVPGFALKILYGELADAALINGQRVVPRRALDLGFTFKHPGIRETMTSAFQR